MTEEQARKQIKHKVGKNTAKTINRKGREGETLQVHEINCKETLHSNIYKYIQREKEKAVAVIHNKKLRATVTDSCAAEQKR